MDDGLFHERIHEYINVVQSALMPGLAGGRGQEGQQAEETATFDSSRSTEMGGMRGGLWAAVGALLLASSTLAQTPVTSCESDIPKPQVPGLPTWAGSSIAELESMDDVFNIPTDDGVATGAYRKDTQMVIKTCDAASLHAAVDYSLPNFNGGQDPTWSIWFDCGSDTKHVIYVERTLQFGSGASTTFGTYALISRDRNVELNGSFKYRIMLIQKGADVLLSGLTFRHGKQVGFTKNIDEVPEPGGFNGAAIEVTQDNKLTVERCNFLNNRSHSHFYHKGQGAAIHMGLRSIGIIWGCRFERNHSTTGGAVASVTSETLFVSRSRFKHNAVYGGIFPASLDSGQEKATIVARGAALRVDSVRPNSDGSDAPHVLLCGNEFIGNKLVFKTKFLTRMGYETTDWQYVKASGAGVWVFNKSGNLDLPNGDKNLAVIKDCSFNTAQENVEEEGTVLGAYVVEAEGAGDITLQDLTFTNNNVNRALIRLLQIPPADTQDEFVLTMKDISLSGNGPDVDTVFYIQAPNHEPICEISNVDGLVDGTYNCFARD